MVRRFAASIKKQYPDSKQRDKQCEDFCLNFKLEPAEDIPLLSQEKINKKPEGLSVYDFHIVDIESFYVSNGDDVEEINVQGGQKGGQKEDFTETLQKLYRNLTEIDRKIVELIVADKSVTTTKMATQIGKSRQTVAMRIKELQGRGVIKRNGPDKGGFWEICELEDNNE